jgi:hypothetical protein
MKNLKKRAIPLLIIAIFALSIVLPVLALSAPTFEDEDGNPITSGDKGDTVVVIGGAGEVTAGATLNLYWDSVKAWDGEKGLLNSTEGKSSGAYEVWFDVPEATAGDHYVWVKDMESGDTASAAFTVLTKIKLSASSGLEGDKVTIDGYGFDDEQDIAIIMSSTAMIPDGTNVVGEEGEGNPDGTDTEYDFTLDNTPVEPGSVTITDGTQTLTDDGDGTLSGDGDGDINYVTGEVDVDFNSPPPSYTDIDADYEYYADVADTINVISTAVDSDDVGSWAKAANIPDDADMATGDYYIYAYDAKGNDDDAEFTKGAVIRLDPEEGPVGTKVEIRGRGFDPAETIIQGEVIIWDEDHTKTPVDCYIVDAPEDVDTDGDFKLEVVIPQVDMDDYDTINVTDGAGNTAEAEFEVTGEAEIEVDPEFGVQGAKINVEGFNFTAMSDEEVLLELWDEDLTAKVADIDDFETNSAGEFEGSFTVPAVTSDPYKIVAIQSDYNIDADTSFRVGLMIVILSPNEGPTGTWVTLTGTGFEEDGEWNATMDGEEIFSGELADSDGSISDSFYVPTIPAGTYTVTVTDVDTDIQVKADFEVTHTTMVEIDPMTAPNEYNVTLEGKYFTANEGESLEFVLYNETDEWDMDVYQYNDDMNPKQTAEIWDDDGNFTAWWIVPKDDDLSLRDYTINITDGEDLFAQVEFSIVSETIEIEPRKSAYDIGDTVSFDIKSSFKQEESYIKIWDPDDNLFWRTDDLDDWVKIGVLRVVPFYAQAVNGYPMTLPTDAPTGTWTWTYYDDDDDEIDSGSFTVSPAPEEILSEQIAELDTAVSDLSSDLGSLKDDVSGLAGDVDSLASSVAEAAAAANAASQAASDAIEAVADVADTASSAAAAAENAAQAASEAKTAAEDAGKSAGGLSTLVYGAIGASLVAALAAIVSLMQISRRIAG